ncbi:MAG: PEP-CTERM sorting domain-containing protein [Patescibacteria group bacterium]|nr:PEP-CTERM sorting domain-containing protein [Patescibacteria group bacterium]
MHLCSRSTRLLRALLPVACSAALLLGLSGLASAQTTTLHKDYQVVTSTGASAWTGTGTVVMTGVVINNASDMLNYSSASPQWQVYFQAVDANDFGGTAMYMRRYHPGSGSDLFPDASTPNWIGEMTRLNYPVYTVTGEAVTEPLRRGDLIQVTANAPGMFFNGKRNVNTMHKGPASSYEPDESYADYLFSIVILRRDVELTASEIALSALKDVDNNFIFDASRLTGCEHYQGSLVHLENLLLDNPGDWALDGTVLVRQGDLTFPMKLGIDSNLLSIDAALLATTPFSVTAILDQESSDLMAGYRLWLTNAGDLTVVPEPGTVLLVLAGVFALLPLRRRNCR